MSDDPTSRFWAERMARFAARTELASPTVRVKEMTPMERQRHEDGTQITTNGRMAFKPEGARLYLAKGSLLGQVPDTRLQPTKQDPPAFEMGPNDVVKSYLQKAKDASLRKEHKDPDGERLQAKYEKGQDKK